MATWKQAERQRARRKDGRYEVLNPCYICSKSAGADYASDHRTDTTDSAGNQWGDVALCLCPQCATNLAKLPDDQAYRIASQQDQAPWLARKESEGDRR